MVLPPIETKNGGWYLGLKGCYLGIDPAISLQQNQLQKLNASKRGDIRQREFPLADSKLRLRNADLSERDYSPISNCKKVMPNENQRNYGVYTSDNILRSIKKVSDRKSCQIRKSNDNYNQRASELSPSGYIVKLTPDKSEKQTPKRKGGKFVTFANIKKHPENSHSTGVRRKNPIQGHEETGYFNQTDSRNKYALARENEEYLS